MSSMWIFLSLKVYIYKHSSIDHEKKKSKINKKKTYIFQINQNINQRYITWMVKIISTLFISFIIQFLSKNYRKSEFGDRNMIESCILRDRIMLVNQF